MDIIRCLRATYTHKILSLFLGQMFMDTRCLRATYRHKILKLVF
jgi:hypothetical protein